MPAFEPVVLDTKEQGETGLRVGGVYLITGGLGGIGLAMAEHLARRWQARLVLLGRTGLPPRSQWEELLHAEHADASEVRRVRQIQALEAHGAEVLIIQADVSDPLQLHAALQQTLATFGELHGVLHAAGVPARGLIQCKTPEMVERVLAPKVAGTLALAQALQHIPLDFLALFSSICSTTGGGPGQVDYCAANAFLDAFAHCANRQGSRVVVIDWGEWQWNAWEAGLAGYPAEAQQYFRLRRERFGISFAEGSEALERVLASGLAHVIVSTENVQQMAGGSSHFSTETILRALVDLHQAQAVTTYKRPLLHTPYVAPTSDLEREVAARWSELLGIEQIGIDDNFLELGGHSLLGTQLVARLRQAFQVNIRLSTLFAAPTVRELAMAIELLLIEELEQTGEDDEVYAAYE
jgi:NAD(P)-dependent dehydrogenase (short-subunit alcohol dehydrogenase family)/acyl carrier protein